ncbi:MAG: exodeoxyribonuclease VII large subunit [Bacteroidales bacterium]|nr:exodeoxyribonuclease VII large subunit [Bacteroidales bacterium]
MEENTYNDRKVYSLSDVAQSLKGVIEQNYVRDFYVKAEISKLNYYPHSGHCYPDLVEKSGGRITAQLRSTIWSSDYFRIQKKFEEVTGNSLSDGLQVLCLARVTFHPSYGLSLHIKDVVPEYSLGELAKAKQETIAQLQKDGVFNLNKTLAFPLLPKHIAVVSVSTSKGYEDFMSIMKQAPHPISTYLFPALLQGDGAILSISEQLKKIATMHEHFDAAVIVRGGGGDVGLSCYDNYGLASLVANFPLPVITGIGHSTNVTVSEMVAYYAAITPTDTANFLLEKQLSFADKLEYFQNNIAGFAGQTLTLARQNIQLTKEKIRLLDPKNILKRGFSLTTKNGKLVKSSKGLKQGDVLKTMFSDGEATSIIK